MRKHDIQYMGIRRYRLSYFRKPLKDIGFIVVQNTFYSISFIPALVMAIINYVSRKKNKTIQNHEEVKELQIPNIVINRFFFTDF